MNAYKLLRQNSESPRDYKETKKFYKKLSPMAKQEFLEHVKKNLKLMKEHNIPTDRIMKARGITFVKVDEKDYIIPGTSAATADTIRMAQKNLKANNGTEPNAKEALDIALENIPEKN